MSETFEEYKHNVDYHRRKDTLNCLNNYELFKLLPEEQQDIWFGAFDREKITEYILENNLDKDYR